MDRYYFFPTFFFDAPPPMAASRRFFSRSSSSSFRALSASSRSSFSAFFRAASCSRFSLMTASRARSAFASSVLPSACSFWYRSFACCACTASRSRRLSCDMDVLPEPALLGRRASAAEGSRGAAEAWSRADLVWFGFAGATSSEEDPPSPASSEEDDGRSPGAVALACLRASTASFLALVAARRASRVRSGLAELPSSAEEDYSDDEPSEDSISGFTSRGSWYRREWVSWPIVWNT